MAADNAKGGSVRTPPPYGIGLSNKNLTFVCYAFAVSAYFLEASKYLSYLGRSNQYYHHLKGILVQVGLLSLGAVLGLQKLSIHGDSQKLITVKAPYVQLMSPKIFDDLRKGE